MTANTILSKSIDNQTIENPLQSLQEKKEEKKKVKKIQPKLILSILICQKRIQREKKSVYLERKYLLWDL